MVKKQNHGDSVGDTYAAAIAALLLVLTSSLALASSYELSYSGRLVETTGKPVTGPVDFEVNFFRIDSGGEPIDIDPVVVRAALSEGIFTLPIRLTGAEFHRVFNSVNATVFIEVTDKTRGVTFARQKYGAIPYALKVPIDDKTLTYNNDGQLQVAVPAAAAGQFLTVGSDGRLILQAPAVTAVTEVGGISASAVASGATAASQASSLSGSGTIVKRDGTGGFAATSFAADSVTLTASSTTSKPLVVKGSAGQSANLQEWLSSTGALLAGVGADGALKLGSAGNFVSLKAPAGLGASATYVLPAAPDNGKYLMTDASGNLSWTSPTIASGTLSPSLGSAAAPSYSFSGDSDTGIWSAGADTLSASTAGSERLRLDAAGRLGIGTSTPTAHLDVRTNAASALTGTVNVTAGTTAVTGTGTFFTSESAVGDAIRIGAQTLTVAAIADDTNLTLSAAHTAGGAAATAFTDASLFRIKNSAGTTKFVVARNGNVGVGSITPGHKLSVDGTFGILERGVSPTFYSIFQGGDQAADITYTLPAAQGGNGSVLTNNGSGVLSWSGATVPASGTLATVAGSETLTNKMLNSTNTITGATAASLTNSGATITLPTVTGTLATLAGTETLTNKTLTAPVIFSISNTGTLTLPTSSDTLVGRATTDTLTNKTLTAPVISTISNTGTLTLPTSTDTLVGRATTDTLTNKTLTSPIINGGTMNVALGAVATPSYSFSGDADTGIWSSGADTLNFSTAGAERMRVSSTGNVGIGTTSPTSKLDTNDTSAQTVSYTSVLHNALNTSSTASINKVGMNIESTGTWNGVSATNTALVLNATGGTTNNALTVTNPAAVNGSGYNYFNFGSAWGGVVANIWGGNFNFAGTGFTQLTLAGNLNVGNTNRIGFSSGTAFSAGMDTVLSRRAAANLQMGAADAAAPISQTLSVQSVVAGTSNTAGTDFTIAGSQGTGTGAGGGILFKTAPAGSTGTSQNALATAVTITGAGNVGIGTTSPASTLSGPIASTFAIAASAPTQAAASVAGNALNLNASSAVAGTSTAGAAAGGSINITAGDAQKLTSGTATGGNITVTAGTGAGASGTGTGGAISLVGGAGNPSNGYGGAITLTGGTATGGSVGGAVSIVGGPGPVGGAVNITGGSGGAGHITLTSGIVSGSNSTSGNISLIVSDVTSNTQSPGSITIKAGRGNYNTNTNAYGSGGAISIITQGGANSNNGALPTNTGGSITTTLGAGGNNTGGGTAGTAGNWTVTGATGGTGTGAGSIGGVGSTLTLTSGAGGAGVATGGNSGAIVLQSGAAGTGTVAGTQGSIQLAPTSGNVGIGTTGPESKLQVAGAIATAIASKTVAYTLTISDSVILADATTSAFTVTLPTAVGATGRQYTIKKIDSSANAVTLGTTSAQTIDGLATQILATQWEFLLVASDGANWVIVGND